MKKILTILAVVLIAFTSRAQNVKVFEYVDSDVFVKPAPTVEFLDWIKENNTKIGEKAPLNKKKSTKVTLVFNVGRQGEISKVFVWKGIGQGYDVYASRLIKENPFAWSPGENRDSEQVQTKVYYQLDFRKNKNQIVTKDNEVVK